MTRIEKRFAELRSRGGRALIPYLTAGFPKPEATLQLLQALERGGCDIIELGVPFSDPIADGPTIQRASAEALEQGTTLKAILEMVREFRRNSELPLLLFGAYNPFFHYGVEKLATDAAAAGVDALLIPDVPADEGNEIQPILNRAGLDLIYLAAPTTPAQRKQFIASRASGFIYYISLKGVTGARQSLQFQLTEPLKEFRAITTLPIAVGFGIATPEQAAEVAKVADGVVVGSALVDLISRQRHEPDLIKQVEEFARQLKAALPGHD